MKKLTFKNEKILHIILNEKVCIIENFHRSQ